MTLLERRRPQDFARRFEAKVETTIDQHVTFSVEALSPERQRALAELALKSLPAPVDVVEGVVVSDLERCDYPYCEAPCKRICDRSAPGLRDPDHPAPDVAE